MFKLLIESTKDIDSININFSDGTSSVTTKKPPKHKKAASFPNEYLNDSMSDYDDAPVNDTIIEKPEIPDTTDRDVKLAENIQNLNI